MTVLPEPAAPRGGWPARAWTDAARRRPRRNAAGQRAGAFAGVTVHQALEPAAAAWRQLEAVAHASAYQTFGWNAAWLATEGRASGTRPLLGVAHDERGRPVALLPLGLSRRGPASVASFLGGKHANYNLGLFDPSVPWTRAEVERLLRAVADAAPARPDLFALTNQPYEWDGWSNPLALLPGQASPSQSHRADLLPDGETFLRTHLSAASRKKMRSKASQLEAMGPVRHLRARDPAEIEAVLDAHLQQKAAKLASLGVVSRADTAAMRPLLEMAATAKAEGGPALELHALVCGDGIVATFGALSHAGRCSGLLISHEADAAVARLSPGELLLAAVIRAKCAEGYSSFDLGIGEARYKQGFCPIDDPLFDSLLPVTARGRLFVACEATRLRLKGRIKRSAWAWPALKQVRKRLAGLRRRG